MRAVVLWGCASLLSVVMVCAQGVTAPSASRHLKDLLASVQRLSGDFQQQPLTDNKTALSSSGHFALQKPGRFRWVIVKPEPQLIVADGKRVWFYDQVLEQVTVRSLRDSVGQTPAKLLIDSASAIDQAFTVSYAPAKKNISDTAFYLRAKNKDSEVRAVLLTFHRDILSMMTVIDAAGQRNRIVFTKVKRNPVLAKTLFAFHPPPDVDVINAIRRQR